MSDHDFEKQVRQKLNSLKIIPSAEAWEKIEQRLRERRRRRPLLWLPLLLAGIAAGGYYFAPALFHLHSGSDNTTAQLHTLPQNTTGTNPAAAESTQAIHSKSDNSINDKAINGADKPKARAAENQAVEEKKRAGANEKISGEILDRLSGSGPATPAAAQPHHRPAAIQSHHRPAASGAPDPSAGKTGTVVSPPVLERPDVQHHDNPAKDIATSFDKPVTAPADGVSSPVAQPSDSVHHSPQPEKNSVPQSSVQSAAEKNPTVLEKNPPAPEKNPPATLAKKTTKAAGSKWSYAVDFYTGVSAVNRNVLSAKKSTVAMMDYPASSFSGVVANYAPIYKPATTSPGLTFSAGLEVKRELSKRFSLSTGLEYTQMNTLLKAGDQYINAQMAYGLRGYLISNAAMVQNEVREYRNKYHFIELPVVLHTKLISNEKLPLYWNAGLVVSRLLSSTSAHFDAVSGIYYQDNGLVNQTQVGVTTGFSLALFNKTSHPLWVGPSVRSNISSVLKKAGADDRRFVTLGLDLKWFWKK